MSETFHVGDVLSVTTGRLVSPRGMSGVYEVLNYLTGENLFTHQLPRAMEACRPVLLERHPWLEAAGAGCAEAVHDAPTLDAWLAGVVARFGATVALDPVPPGAYAPMPPLAELVETMGVPQSKVVTVVVPR